MGVPISEAWGDKTQKIAIIFGMLVIGLDENTVLIDEPARKKTFLGHPYGHLLPTVTSVHFNFERPTAPSNAQRSQFAVALTAPVMQFDSL